MSRVIFDISMSLDGFVTAAGQTPEQPMGDGGLRLVEWAFEGDERDRKIIEDGIAGLGAVIAGRRTYDHSLPWWGANGPTQEARVPVFVVTHSAPDDAPEGGVYTFVTGIEEALRQARDTAGNKYVTVMGGAEIGRQFLRAGLVDELSLHVVPVLFGSGTRMFEDTVTEHVDLDLVELVTTDAAAHLRLRVKR